MRILLVTALAVLVLAPPSGRAEEASVVEQLLKQIPRATPGQFPTAESVAKEFYGALLVGDERRMMVCFPIHSYQERSTFADFARNLGGYDARSAGLPGDEFGRFHRTLAIFLRPVSMARLSLLEARDPKNGELIEQFQSMRDGEGKIDPAKIASLEKRLDVRTFPRFSLDTIVQEVQEEGKANSGRLAVENRTALRVTMKGGKKPVTHRLWVAKHAGSFQILDLDLHPVP